MKQHLKHLDPELREIVRDFTSDQMLSLANELKRRAKLMKLSSLSPSRSSTITSPIYLLPISPSDRGSGRGVN